MDINMLIATTLAFISIGIFDALQDSCTFYGHKSKYNFGWWTSKYKIPLKVPKKGSHWWYFKLYKPFYNERFPFSTSILVFLTDGVHLYKWIKYSIMEIYCSFLICNYFNINYLYIILCFIMLKVLRGIGFNIFFQKNKN